MSDQIPQNPYAATSTLETQSQPTLNHSYGGFGRLAYFGYTFLAGILLNVAIFVLAIGTGGEGAGMLLVFPLYIGYLVALFWIVGQRMTNCGYSPWWCLGMLVPLLNILVGVRAIACPEGYADHRTLDTAGKVIVGLFLAMFALVAIFVVIAAVSGPAGN